MKIDNSFKPRNLNEMWSAWLAPLRYCEPSLIVSYPGNDNVRRINQLVLEKDFVANFLKTTKEICWVELDYRQEKWTSAGDFWEVVEHKHDSNKLTIMVLRGFEILIKDRREDLVLALRQLYRKSDFRVMLVSENNYFDPDNQEFILTLKTFEPRIVSLPLYDQDIAHCFVRYLAEKWEIKIEESKVSEIANAVGGNLGLLKEVVWYLRDHGLDKLTGALNSENLLWQVKSLWNGLLRSDREYLTHIVFDIPVKNNLEMTESYLRDIGFLTRENKVALPLLANYIRKYEQNPMGAILRGEKILINQVDYSQYFTHKQRLIMKELLSSSGTIVTREKLIELVWGSDEGGSDWALDSQINRLREKLKSLGIGTKHLITRRGKGLGWVT